MGGFMSICYDNNSAETLELKQKNDLLLLQNDELKQKNDLLLLQNDELTQKNNLILTQNDELMMLQNDESIDLVHGIQNISEMDRESLVYMAKLAEQAERFDEMVEYMKAVVHGQQYPKLTVEERNLLYIAYKNKIGSRRISWRVISTVKKTDDPKKLSLIQNYKKNIESELEEICYKIIEILLNDVI
jgi:hypothetical protein